MKSINELAKEVYENAKSKGWYNNGGGTNIGEKIALIHSELSEALEADRKNRYAKVSELEGTLNWGDNSPASFKLSFERTIKDTFQDEIADVVIRCFDMSVHLGFDLEKHIEAKMRYNSLRPQMHGGKKY